MFFRSNDARCDWLAALGAVLEAAALIDSTVTDADADADADARAGAHFVLRTGTRLLTGLIEQFASSMIKADYEPIDVERFRTHSARLADVGFELVSNETAALARFHKYEAKFVPALSALAARLRIDLNYPSDF